MVDYWSLGCILFEFLSGFPPFAAPTMEEVWVNVYHWREVIERPVYDGEDEEFNLSDNAWDLITKLVTDRRARLDSLSKIRNHPFFESFHGTSWDTIRSTEEPPFVPQLESDLDTTYFDDFNNPDDLELYKDVQNKQKELSDEDASANTVAAAASSSAKNNMDPFNRYAFVGFTFRHKDARHWRSNFESYLRQESHRELPGTSGKVPASSTTTSSSLKEYGKESGKFWLLLNM